MRVYESGRTGDDDQDAAFAPGWAVQQLLMLAATNEIVEGLHVGARALRKVNGDLSGPEHAYTLPGGGELTLSVGDQVLLRINDYRGKRSRGESEDVMNGYRGIVRAVEEEHQVLVEWREKTALRLRNRRRPRPPRRRTHRAGTT